MLITSLIIPEQYDISIEFTEELPLSQVVADVSEMSAPNVVLWYIGIYGLKTPCVKFYRENLISPILANNPEITFSLVDLTAWFAFKNPKGSVNKASSCIKIIENFNTHTVKCLPSSRIFQRMFEITDNYIVDHFAKIFEKILIQNIGGKHPLQGMTVGDIFTQDIPILNTLINVDSSRAYSAIQYLEGCLIIESIVKDLIKKSESKEAEIAFILPNDELKYYKVEDGLFKKSVELIIIQICRELGIDQFDLKVKFFAFPFGTHREYRPYNIPGDSVKKSKLTIEDVIGVKT